MFYTPFCLSSSFSLGNACNYSPYDPTAIMIASLNDSVNETNARSSFSNYGPCIDFFAPGADVLGAISEGPTSSSAASGTSIAAAIATGVGALYLDEINAKRTKYSLNIGSIPAEVKERMDRRGYRDSVTNLGAGSPNVMITVHLQGQSSLQGRRSMLLWFLHVNKCKQVRNPSRS